MPELPEVEIIARRLSQALDGSSVDSSFVKGAALLKSFDPPITELNGKKILGVRRRGKMLVVDFSGGLSLMVHLMSAGRMQLFDKPSNPRDRTLRMVLKLEDARELRLREFGTRQSMWAKLIPTKRVEEEEMIATLGPEAWPEVPDLASILSEPRPLHSVLRDQRAISGIGRSWVDEILHDAMLSPFKRADSLTPDQVRNLGAAIERQLSRAIVHYEAVVELPLPDKLPMPLLVHGKTGRPCPRCSEGLEGVHFEDHSISYCPSCQTGGKVLKDRRLSRLLK